MSYTLSQSARKGSKHCPFSRHNATNTFALRNKQYCESSCEIDFTNTLCVQVLIDSRIYTIRNECRISLRPSSIPGPRHWRLKDIDLHIHGWGCRCFALIDLLCISAKWFLAKNKTSKETCTSPIVAAPIKSVAAHSGNLAEACEWSFRRFTYGNLVTTSPSSKW